MNYLEKIEELIKLQNGTILSADLDKYGIPRKYLHDLISEGKLERCDRGVYVATDAIEDEMFAMQKKYSKLIYSHETALFIHDLSDRTPFEYSATVPSGYKVVSNVADRFKIYYIKKELHELGAISVNSSFGNEIRVYNIERTICDIIKSRSRIDIQILNEALRRYVKIKSSDYFLLMEYAKKLKIETVLKNYLEVLL
ncbi:type IV toxin-antitoxin system AbiEi family antitoxin domain-containing protein [Fusibacter ferrireducens]|uniref:Type IV toxin-antitoxin system AbiEi family antitoxin domain-containing protein n=1 Tax=Fusibacter ferrireducens TaxID=2785058 RepID=A0ABR9ZQP6_9FIRM|nr:type IV toxin-antitoxin system AbiEi family antitoxin domain-containing protein [Fusibacter ferrireducens]MBF4692250.1 type IV toxin-antitoxin system AbiEi family antitoxin domain-containing protein [Fusibacter ferrireducens]